MSSSRRQNEPIGIVLFFLAIVLALFFYLPAETTGVIGLAIKSLGFGLLGVSAHVIPVFIAYAGIDLFFEKRTRVARMRVKYVIFLMVLISAIFAAFTMDFEYLQSLCFNPTGAKTSAFKACQLLWKSGMDGTLITKADSTINVIPGGLLGGLIATSLQKVCGAIVTRILLFGFTLVQIILIFQISVKSTAKAIGSATKKQISNYRKAVDNRGKPSAHTKGILPESVYNKPGNGTATAYPQPTVVHIPSVQQPVQPVQPVQTVQPAPSMYVNQVVKEVPIIGSEPVAPVIPEYPLVQEEDPFNVHPSLPTDRTTGFIDIGEAADQSTDSIKYGEKQVEINNGYSADFSYTANRKNPALQEKKKADMFSFDPQDASSQKEFYNLEGGEMPPYPAPTQSVDTVGEYSSDDDLPIEIVGDVDDGTYVDEGAYVYDETDDQYQGPGVRTPNVPVGWDDQYNQVPVDTTISTNVVPQPVVAAPVNPVVPTTPVVTTPVIEVTTPVVASTVTPDVTEPAKVRDDIKINDPLSIDGASSEGRTMDMSSNAPTDVPTAPVPQPTVQRNRAFRPAPTTILSSDKVQKNANNSSELKAKAAQLEEALKSYGIEAQVKNITYGPSITRFELTLKTGIKVSRVLSLTDDIQLAMAAISVRIEAPIPGTSMIGIEIPNDKTSAVHLRNLLETEEFRTSSPLTVALGRDIPNRPILCNLAKMPHLLVAGSTGSGKSVCINSILVSILCKATPDQVRLILIDPKQVELSIYNGIPHLITPVVVDPKKATNALKWAVQEMNDRYRRFAEAHVRNMDGYNAKIASIPGARKMPLILLVIDEFADIMTVAAKEVEEQVMRLAAMARAAGIHMILATQRPSVDVITGVLKNNMPSRIAFAVTSGVDSRTILDSNGAEKLLGKGDMLYAPQDASKPIRGQGAFVPDEEVEKVIEFLRKQGTMYDDSVNNFINNVSTEANSGVPGAAGSGDGGSAEDDLLEQAVDIVIEQKAASVSILQRRLGIGYPRAARLIDVMEQNHYIGPFEGSKPRKVLITKTDWLEIKAKK